jgi:hypothetical protein
MHVHGKPGSVKTPDEMAVLHRLMALRVIMAGNPPI